MGERLGVLDRAFVQVEREGLPMHVGGLAVLDSAARPDGPIRPTDLRKRLRGRLRGLPLLTARLDAPPLGLGPPSWVPDAGFDVGRHLEEWMVAPGGDWSDVLELAGDLHARLLPRERPLWRMDLIDGLAGGRQALLTTTHHAITDGIAGVEVAQAVFDHAASAAPPPGAANGFFGSADGTGGLTRALQAAAGVARYLAGGPVAVPGPFNGAVGPRRALATADLRLADAIAIKRRLGGSVDDVVLAAVALALGAHLRTRGLPAAERVRAIVPVSTRAGGRGLGNQVTAMFLDLPIGLPPVRCLHEIAAAKALNRTWHESLGVRAALEATGRAPAVLASPLTQLLCALPFANLIVSDVPGPPEPLSLLGAPMVAAYPLMPLTPSVGLSIAVLTIGGTMGVGVTTDPDLVPGGDELAREVETGFHALMDAARPDGGDGPVDRPVGGTP
jgi:WS/DGAT/MGAT family acyltransferase